MVLQSKRPDPRPKKRLTLNEMMKSRNSLSGGRMLRSCSQIQEAINFKNAVMSWVSLWLLKPTQIWTTKWKHAEDSANDTIFGYYGLSFAVYTFPIVAIAILGLLLLDLKAGYQRSRWQLKYHKIAIRFGLLAEPCMALLLLPILRGLAVFRILGIQFEASVRYPTWVGTAMIIFATIHCASTLLVWGISHHIQDEIWKWQKTGRIYLAGEIALVVGLVIWVTSLPQIRRRKFEIFYYTHHLYAFFPVFFLFHAGDRHFYTVFPGIFLFSLDKPIRIIQSSPKTCMVSARILPSRAVELILPEDPGMKYNPTCVIFLKIPTISHLQWHSFSIISSSRADDYILSVIIKCEGWWANSLYDLIHAELDKTADKRKGIPVAIEGPYGPASLDFLRYDSLLLVAGGSGITPFLSILAETDSSTSKTDGPESPSWMAAIAGFCSITFLIFLICFNRIIIPSGKHSKMAKEKTPSWAVDLLLIAAFILALACSASVAAILRWRRPRKGIPQRSHREINPLDLNTFGKLRNEIGGSISGVLVCGPESMKESVAFACQQESECFKVSGKRTGSCFTFHSLNFTL
ncbi:hypothetical protein JHK82_011753 [Glycine max]|nr:hypothetical protein JHK82_011753 [Glycine max]